MLVLTITKVAVPIMFISMRQATTESTKDEGEFINGWDAEVCRCLRSLPESVSNLEAIV